MVALTALLYNFGFFTLLAYTPFPLDMGAHADRADLLRLGRSARDHLGVRGSAAAAPARARCRSCCACSRCSPPTCGDGAVHRHKAVLVGRRRGLRVLPRHQQHAGDRDGHDAAPVERGAPRRRTASSASPVGRSRRGWPGKLGETISPRVPFAVGAAATVLAVLVLSGGRTLRHIDTPDRHTAAEAVAKTSASARCAGRVCRGDATCACPRTAPARPTPWPRRPPRRARGR